MRGARLLALLLAALAPGAVALVACGEAGSTSTTVGGGGNGGMGGAGGQGGALDFDAGASDAEADACVAEVYVAEPVVEPIDVVFVIDNSGSMVQEIDALEASINDHFAAVFEMAGSDYQVVVVSQHGAGETDVCIEAPLSTIPVGGCRSLAANAPPGDNPGRFHHFSHEVQSHDALCVLLDRFAGVSDPFGLSDDGYGTWLRPEAAKAFVVVTDDRVNCAHGGEIFNSGNQVALGKQVAAKWDDALLDMAPTQFGTLAERDYQLYSLVGLGAQSTSPDAPWSPGDAVTETQCATAAAPGVVYQWLSVGTQAIRWPVCDGAGFETVFETIAASVIEGATLPCTFALPAPPPGEVFDLQTLEIVLDSQGDTTILQQAPAGVCSGEQFILDGQNVTLCESACAIVTGDPNAALSLELGCGGPPQ